MSDAVKAASRDWNSSNPIQINAKYKHLRMESGSEVFKRVIAGIDEADICIFDLTDKNSNVLFELGHANGRNKQIVWICNEDVPLPSLPSDFQGRFILRYEDANDLAPSLESEVLSRIHAVLKGYTEDRAFKEVWEFGQSTSLNLVFGQIPETYLSRFGKGDDPNHLRYQSVADIDTLVSLSRFLSRNFPHLVQEDYKSGEFKRDMDRPLIAVGGPGWNAIARRYYGVGVSKSPTARLPLEFDLDELTGEDVVRMLDSGDVLKANDLGNGEVEDIGIFAKFEDKRYNVPVYVISGIRTGGVLGSALVLSDNANGRRNCQYLSSLDEDLQEFLIVFKVICVSKDGIAHVETPILNNETILYLNSLNVPLGEI